METFGERLKTLRERKWEEDGRCTQENVGKAMGITGEQYRKWEKRGLIPDSEKIVKLAEYFDVSVDYLLRGGDKEHLKLMNKTGLSDSSISMLETYKEKYNTRITSLLDLIIADPQLFDSLAHYVFDDLTRITINDSEGYSYPVHAKSISFPDSQYTEKPASDFEAMYRVQIMDMLKKLREKVQKWQVLKTEAEGHGES